MKTNKIKRLIFLLLLFLFGCAQLSKKEKSGTPLKGQKISEKPSEEPVEIVKPNEILHRVSFRLMCRDTDGTVSDYGSSSLTPISNAKVKWRIDDYYGIVKTNSRGSGYITFHGPGSFVAENIQLIYGNNALSIDVQNSKRIVVPSYWCR